MFSKRGERGPGKGPDKGKGPGQAFGSANGHGTGQPSGRQGSMVAARRHGRRPMRSSMTGPYLANPESRLSSFETIARSALELIQHEVGDELQGVQIGFATAPTGLPAGGQAEDPRGTSTPTTPPINTARDTAHGTARESENLSEHPLFYSIDRNNRTIMLFRMPIQRAKVLHVDDAEHRAYFIGHCVHRAVCEYLGREPWELLPGQFDHY